MIYQFYYGNNRVQKTPFSPLYVEFDLAAINDPTCLLPIGTEYVGFIHCWKNKLDNDSWIGFTSHRQIEKSGIFVHYGQQPANYIFRSRDFIENKLKNVDILTWGWQHFKSLEYQAEESDPGITEATLKVYDVFDRCYPLEFSKKTSGIFANYWIMSKDNFNKFMEWSYPLAQWMVEHHREDPFYSLEREHRSGVGAILERMFMQWYILHNKSIFDVVSNVMRD
jgi:hypothetical protein